MLERRIVTHLHSDLFFFLLILKLLRHMTNTIPVAFMAAPQGRTTPKVFMAWP